MNTFFVICIIGIAVNVAGIAFNLYIFNIIGSILSLIGFLRLDIPGTLIKKCRRYAIISIPFSILAFLLSLIDATSSGNQTITSVALGINIFFFIYMTYYFTETLIDYARFIHELAATRSFRSVWTLCGIVAFIYFMANTAVSLNSIILIILRIVMLISSLYYCFSIYNSSKPMFLKK